MGLLMSRLFDLFSSFNSGRETRILMVGLDAAGKTTILYKLKLNENVSTIPTIGFNVETVAPVKGLNFTVWDVGGQTKIRPLWRHYFQNTQGVLYVVDSSDVIRLEEAREELFGVMEDDTMRGVPLVVLANKQDLPGAITPAQMIDRLQLRKLHSKWHVQGCCALNGEGIYESMDSMGRLVRETS